MPSITIRFDWATNPAPRHAASTLHSMASRLQRDLINCFTENGEAVLPWQATFADENTIDAVIDDGAGITHTDRATATVDDEQEAKARSRAEEE